MYLNFFNLKKEPFNITPDPELLFLSPSHKEALAAVIYGVKQRKGFIAIIGEVGVGKTTILRSFLDKANKQQLKTIYLFNANLSFKALLRTLYQGLGLTPENEDIYEMVDRLHHQLIEEYRAGNNVVLVIDEAQNMPVETLENLRMLSNLETATDKLIQVVFSGQPEFEEKLNGPSLRQFKQRIVISVRILPLTAKESRAYIEHRLAKTALGDPELFSSGALKKIIDRANGIPRVINILCDNCLITSFGNQQKQVSSKVAGEIIGEFHREKPSRLARQLALPAALLLLCLFLLFLWDHLHPLDKSSAAVRPQVSVEPLPASGAKASPPAQSSQSPHPAELASSEQPAAGDGDQQGVRKVVRRGDTLASLIKQNYGVVNRRLIRLVKQHNPNIVNENVIVEGDRIVFPER
ncbi:ExeA family protein [Geomonas sp.]|uniref:ExeA family protein n=1 Tax=Geomonas sp. TaxID=2651584 RepID=UPI002B48F80F|nr:AAA family ATPase [Geomonas sp.]HJV36947.1 AAA family ATPase [Geomonas sp.]